MSDPATRPKGSIRTVRSVRCPVLSNAGCTFAELREAVLAANVAFEEMEAAGLSDSTPISFRHSLGGGELFWEDPDAN